MQIVLLTAFGVGFATMFGTIIGFLFKNITHRFSDIVLGFAAGVMLAAAVVGLILPSMEYGGAFAPVVTVVAIFCGAFLINILDKVVPHLHSLAGVNEEKHPKKTQQINRVILFVTAIAIHNFPEGIAAGVSFGTENVSEAILVAGGIALQNIPEGMVIIGPMLAAGISPKRTLLCALATGVVEIIGTLLGYFAVSISSAILPFALAFAGGTMLYVISDEMIPETHSHGSQRGATYALLIGFSVMLLTDFYLG